MRKIRVLGSIVLLALVFPCAVSASDAGPVRINGFISQGYLNSQENNVFGDTKGGTTQFNELGLTFNTQLNDKLRAGAQILSRDLGDVGNNELTLDWGFADYHYRDALGLRLGKVKLPMGLYNEGRDSDFLRNMVFLPQSIYDETKRDLLVAYQGAGLYGNLSAGPLGDLDYHGFYGTISFTDDSLLNDALSQNGTFTLRSNLGPVLVPAYTPDFGGGPAGQALAQQYVQNINLEDLEIQNDYIGGLSLNTALDGLRMGASYLTVKNDLSFTTNVSIDPTIDASEAFQVFRTEDWTGSLENTSTMVGSLEYMFSDFVFSYEYAETKREQTFISYEGQNATSQSYYAMLSYMMTDKLSLSVLYDVYYSDKDDKDGSDFVAGNPAQRKDFMTWRKDLGIGIRYDVNRNWTLKAEVHDVNGTGLFMTVVNDPAELKEDWSYLALKASFNF